MQRVKELVDDHYLFFSYILMVVSCIEYNARGCIFDTTLWFFLVMMNCMHFKLILFSFDSVFRTGMKVELVCYIFGGGAKGIFCPLARKILLWILLINILYGNFDCSICPFYLCLLEVLVIWHEIIFLIIYNRKLKMQINWTLCLAILTIIIIPVCSIVPIISICSSCCRQKCQWDEREFHHF